MSLKFPNGAVFGFSTTLAAAVAATAVSNAAPAIATIASGVSSGDVLVLNSAWDGANNVVAQALIDSDAPTAVSLLGIDSTDTTLFPAGAANLKAMVADDFVDFTQQGDPSTSGGDQQFWNGQFLEDKSGRQISVPTFKNATTLTLPIYYDPKADWFAPAKRVSALKQPVVLRCKLPDGDVLYRYGYLSLNADPSIAANTPMGNTVTFTVLGDTTIVEAA
jgi:hypothetical protein